MSYLEYFGILSLTCTIIFLISWRFRLIHFIVVLPAISDLVITSYLILTSCDDSRFIYIETNINTYEYDSDSEDDLNGENYCLSDTDDE